MGRLVFDVDDSVHVSFKILCINNGTSMTKAISEFMKRCVDGLEGVVSDKNGVVVPSVAPSVAKTGVFDLDGFRKALGLKSLEDKQKEKDFFDALFGRKKEVS